MKTLLRLAACLLSCGSAHAAEFIPKYGPAGAPRATLLKAEREHVKRSAAPDFWALFPYYEGMRGGHTASAASVAMVLNALRQGARYSSSDELVTEDALLEKVKEGGWAARVRGEKPEGVDLEGLAAIVSASLPLYGLAGREVVVVPGSGDVRKALAENERSDGDFLIAHYTQSAFTDDPEGAVGTFSPVGGFNAKKGRVLILETDRKYYEPYWVSLETFLDGLRGRGLIWIRPQRASAP